MHEEAVRDRTFRESPRVSYATKMRLPAFDMCTHSFSIVLRQPCQCLAEFVALGLTEIDPIALA